jgi:TetR/AcrR family transcriptional repressor of nem operon
MSVTTRDTRQTIVLAAADLFRKQGYAATTVQQVAEVTGISKGNLTYHFPNKAALYEEVHRQVIDYVRTRILNRSFDEAPDARQALVDFTRRLRRWYLDDANQFVGCIFTNIAIETQHSDQAIGKLAYSALGELREMLAERFTQAQAKGEIRADRDPVELARAFFWGFEGALALSRAMNDPAEYDAFCALAHEWLAP